MKTLLISFVVFSASACAQLNYVSVNSSAYCGSNVTATCLQAAITANPHQTLSINPGTWSINSTIYMGPTSASSVPGRTLAAPQQPPQGRR